MAHVVCEACEAGGVQQAAQTARGCVLFVGGWGGWEWRHNSCGGSFLGRSILARGFLGLSAVSLGASNRLCPLSSLGAGNAGSVKKTMNAMNLYLMEAADDESFHSLRYEFKGSCIDQGTERGIAEETVTVIPRYQGSQFTGRANFLLPDLLHIPGHLHIIYNAMKSAALSLSFMASFLEHLRALQDLLSSKKLRKKFQASCLPPHVRGQFKHYSTVHIDWRWEFLSKALDRLLPLYPLMCLYWDEAKMRQGETDKIRDTTIVQVSAAISFKSIPEIGEMLRVQGKALETTAHKLEACFCHEDHCEHK